MKYKTHQMVLPVMTLFIIGIMLSIQPACSTQEKQDDKEKKEYFSGEIIHDKKDVDGKHYFRVKTDSVFPELTRITVTLFYQKDFPDPIDYRVDKELVRANKDGSIETMLLGLKRSLWAGHYKVVFEMDPENQVPSVASKLSGPGKPVKTEKKWFFGSKELLKKQKEEAVKQAREDFYQVLELSEQLQKKMRELRAEDDFDQWGKWSKKWKEKLKKLRKRNNRRPQYEGDFVEFNFVEDRTGYFLQFDIESLAELYKLADRIIRAEKRSQKRTQKFRREYQKLRRSVSRTLTFLNITIPLSKKKRKILKKQLDQLSNRFTSLKKHVDSGSDKEFKRWKKKTGARIDGILSMIMSVDSGIPDFLYHRLLILTQKLNAYSEKLDENGSLHKKQFDRVYKMFVDFRNMAQAYLKEMEK